MSEKMTIPYEAMIWTGQHWSENHRIDAKLPGYLIVQSKTAGASLTDLDDASLAELGMVLARVTAALESELGARRVQIAKYGHGEGYSAHFHVVPVYDWLIEDLLANPRYEKLRDWRVGDYEVDGIDLMLYAYREYCERKRNASRGTMTVHETIHRLRSTLGDA